MAEGANDSLEAAVRAVVRNELAHQPQEDSKLEPTAWQVAWLGVFFADLILVFAPAAHLLLNEPVIELATKLGPALIGAGIVAYFDKLRDNLLTWAKKPWFRWPAGFGFLIFGWTNLHVFSVRANLDQTRAMRVLWNHHGPLRIATSGALTLPSTALYGTDTVTITDGGTDGGDYGDTDLIDPALKLRSILAHIPALGLFPHSRVVPLGAEYVLHINRADPPKDTWEELRITGAFSDLYYARISKRYPLPAGDTAHALAIPLAPSRPVVAVRLRAGSYRASIKRAERTDSFVVCMPQKTFELDLDEFGTVPSHC
jgi:hypothetical protein